MATNTSVVTDPSGKLSTDTNGFLTPSGIQAIINTINGLVGTNGNTSQSGTVNQTGTTATTGTSSQAGTSTNTGTQNATTVGNTSSNSNQTSTQTGTGKSSSSQVSQVALDLLGKLAPGLLQSAGGSDYSKQSAINDSKGTVDMIMKTLQEQTLPQLYSAESSSGAYNSTTKALLGNDAAARAALAGAAAVSDTVGKYGAIQAANNNSLISLVNAASQASRETTGTTSTDATGTQTGSQTGVTNQTQTGVTTNNGATTSTGNTTQDSTNNQIATSNSSGTTAAQGILQNPTAQKAAGAFAIYAGLQKLGIPSAVLNSVKEALGIGGIDLSKIDFSNIDLGSLDFSKIFDQQSFSDAFGGIDFGNIFDNINFDF